jgi:hypothetical protein
MSTYDDEMFNYLTKEENFIPAFELYEIIPDIKERLIKEFWKLVNEKLQDTIKNTQWQTELYIEETKDPYLDLFFDERFKVGYEGFYGRPDIYIYIEFGKNNDLDKKQIKYYVRDLAHFKDFNTEDETTQIISYYQYLYEDFRQMQTLKHILPQNRDKYALDLAKELFNFGENLKPEINKMRSMTR